METCKFYRKLINKTELWSIDREVDEYEYYHVDTGSIYCYPASVATPADYEKGRVI